MNWDYVVTVPEFTGDKEAKIFRKPKTNADLIRAMSDEELADYLRYHSDSYARYDMDCLTG